MLRRIKIALVCMCITATAISTFSIKIKSFSEISAHEINNASIFKEKISSDNLENELLPTVKNNEDSENVSASTFNSSLKENNDGNKTVVKKQNLIMLFLTNNTESLFSNKTLFKHIIDMEQGSDHNKSCKYQPRLTTHTNTSVSEESPFGLYTVISKNSTINQGDFYMKYLTPEEVLKLQKNGIYNFNHPNENTTFFASYVNITEEDSQKGGFLRSNLTDFQCLVHYLEELTIICENVTLYKLGKHLSNATIKLEISNSPTPILPKPLFPHLKYLKYLTLSNNHHRLITKAFIGLESLEYLDLSNNDIIVIAKAFTYVPNLKSLNLTRNEILSVGTIANALSQSKHLQNISLNHNWRINSIQRNDLKPLRNCKILKLELFNTTIKRIEEGAFNHLPYLKILDLSVNYLNEDALINVTASINKLPIEYLFLREMVLINKLPTKALGTLKNMQLFRLDLSYNYFLKLPKLPEMKFLQSLWLTHCSMKHIEVNAFQDLPNLEELVLSGNHLGYMFYKNSLNTLKILILSDQKSRFEKILFRIDNFELQKYKQLEILDLSKILMTKVLGRFLLYGLYNLRSLALRHIGFMNIADYAFLSLHSLEILNLQTNRLLYFTNLTFFGLSSLTNLYLSNNLLTFSDAVYPFHYTTSLLNILLNNNKMEYIPENLFAFTDHIEVLILKGNKIMPWTKRIFGPNSTVITFSISLNSIDHVTPTMLDDFHHVSEYFDFSDNPLNCSKCGMTDFQLFLKTSNLTFSLPIDKKPDKYSLTCVAPVALQSQPFLEAKIPIEDCLNPNVRFLTFASILTISFSVSLLCVIAYVCYVFRWYIKYWLFQVRSKVKEKRNSANRVEKRYKYDAFVSYNSSDSPWVVSHLIPALEREQPKLKLCIHERDFQVGQLITENILEAIEHSRHVILILTEDFVKSEWCMFELHMAQHRLFDETRDSLILIKLKPISKKHYTKNLSYLNKTRMCFNWPNDSISQKLFWNKIRKVLGSSKYGNNSTSLCETI